MIVFQAFHGVASPTGGFFLRSTVSCFVSFRDFVFGPKEGRSPSIKHDLPHASTPAVRAQAPSLDHVCTYAESYWKVTKL